MGSAVINIDTYNGGVSTRINYVPKDINPHTVISVLEMLLRKLKANIDNTGEQVEYRMDKDKDE